MNCHLPRDGTATGADGRMPVAAGRWPGRRPIAVMLLAAAALDLTRCGLVLVTARHLWPAAGLVATGLAAAALSLRTARGWRNGLRWSGWAALLIGAASAPQAAAAGFHAPYTIPDTATAALGILLAVAVLTTADSHRHALLARPLAGCDIEALDEGQARAVGSLAARAATKDIVDACVVDGAIRRHDLVISSDEGDLQAIAAAISHRLEVDHP
jgi:hypothetical protein